MKKVQKIIQGNSKMSSWMDMGKELGRMERASLRRKAGATMGNGRMVNAMERALRSLTDSRGMRAVGPMACSMELASITVRRMGASSRAIGTTELTTAQVYSTRRTAAKRGCSTITECCNRGKPGLHLQCTRHLESDHKRW